MPEDRSFTPLTGGCKCGKVRFRLESGPIITHCCHCRDCQKQSGSAFRVNVMIETDRLAILEGAPRPFKDVNGENEVRCPDCHFCVWAYHPHFGEEIAFIGAGVLDEGERLPPEAHFFIRSKHPWVTLPPGIPAFQELGDAGKASATERVMAVLAARG